MLQIIPYDLSLIFRTYAILLWDSHKYFWSHGSTGTLLLWLTCVINALIHFLEDSIKRHIPNLKWSCLINIFMLWPVIPYRSVNIYCSENKTIFLKMQLKNSNNYVKGIREIVNGLPKPQNRRKYELRLNYRTIFIVCGTDLFIVLSLLWYFQMLFYFVILKYLWKFGKFHVYIRFDVKGKVTQRTTWYVQRKSSVLR